MGKALLIIIVVVLAVYAFFDLLATPRHEIRYLPKALWFVTIVVPVLGPLLWIALGTRRTAPPPPEGRPTGGWRPPSPRGPDDDPDYLRGL